MAYDRCLQAAADGIIPIWGKREPYSVHEPIPNEYWFTNRFEWFDLLKGVEAGKMSVEELTEDGTIRKTHDLPFNYSMMLPAFRGVGAVRGIEKLTNPRGFVVVVQAPAQSRVSEHLCHRRVRGDPSNRRDASPGRRAQDRFHDRIHGDGDRDEYGRIAARQDALGATDVERDLSGRFRRFRGRIPGATADPSAQSQLVVQGRMGSLRQGRLREILPAQDPPRRKRAVLRTLPA
jgi:hypothetical protein